MKNIFFKHKTAMLDEEFKKWFESGRWRENDDRERHDTVSLGYAARMAWDAALSQLLRVKGRSLAKSLAAAILLDEPDTDRILTDLLAEQGKLGMEAKDRIGELRSLVFRLCDFLTGRNEIDAHLFPDLEKIGNLKPDDWQPDTTIVIETSRSGIFIQRRHN